ncbi:MAG: glycerophosphodiester phosphodiesterase [Clostridiaceae bacterium]
MIKNIAHRGASGEYPENTMISFKKAIDMGCDGIETDVQITKDGELILCHDELIDRTTDGKGLINSYNYKELMKFDASYKFKKKHKKNKIPKLVELLELVKDSNIMLNLELKNSVIDYEKIEERVIDLVCQYGIEDRIIISSFNHYSIKKCKEINTSIKCGILYESTIYQVGEYAKSLGVEACHPNFYTLKDYIVKDIKQKGLDINTYTVNEEKYMKMLIGMGVDGIITNYPDKLREIIINNKQ